jgi:hypothetical protein
MFIGHFAVGLAAKRVCPPISLGVLTAAALLPDFLWAVFVLASLEEVRVAPGNTAFTPLAFTSYPFSHSLVMTFLWALLAAVGYLVISRYPRGSVVVGGVVLSHWVLDAISHRPDLPLYPGSAAYVGLGLWNSIPVTLILEGLLFVGGAWIYVETTRSRDWIGSVGLWSYFTALVVLYAGNILGPPPPSGSAVAITDLAGFILVLWAAWVDGHREVRAYIHQRQTGGA